MSKTGFQHCLQMVLKGGARFTCSWSQRLRDVVIGFKWGVSRPLFHLGFPERLRGLGGGAGNSYFSYSHLV